MFKASEALHKTKGTNKIQTISFHQYSWNSEVETSWISLIGWPHRTSSKYLCKRIIADSAQGLFVSIGACIDRTRSRAVARSENILHILLVLYEAQWVEILSDWARNTDSQWSLFHWNPKVLGLGRKIGQKNFGAFGVILAELSAPILVQWILCLSLFNHYFYKRLSVYIQISSFYLGLGFEFGLQRIRNLAFVVRVICICILMNNSCNQSYLDTSRNTNIQFCWYTIVFPWLATIEINNFLI